MYMQVHYTHIGANDGRGDITDGDVVVGCVLFGMHFSQSKNALLLNFFKWANPGLFLVYFLSFQSKNTIFSTNQCEKMSKCPFSIWHQDLNPQPYKHESSPINTRPWLPPHIIIFWSFYCTIKEQSYSRVELF